ncbi:HTTM domain-containing protein [Aeromicrobium sp.]
MIGVFDRWAASGPFGHYDLAIYRIIYSFLVLISLPKTGFVSDFPDSLYAPPPGPFRLLDGVPPHEALFAVDVLVALSLACLAVGFRTCISSLATGTLLMVNYGFTYSFGKIDHTILVAVVPLVLCWADWGRVLSVDGSANPGRGEDADPPPQWPLRLLSVLVGLAFLTAALAKVCSGWLDPSTQAARGHFLRKYVVEGNTGGVGDVLFSIQSSTAWEVADWLTIALEAGMILAVITWPSFRFMIALACLFHLSIMLSMGIAFSVNVIVYGSFVGWAALVGRPRIERRMRIGPVGVTALIGVLSALGLYMETLASPQLRSMIAGCIVVIGAVSASAYLLTTSGRAALRLVRT